MFTENILTIIFDNNPETIAIRQSASIHFKNFCSKCWEAPLNGPDPIPNASRMKIKENLVSNAIKQPPAVQRVLVESISIIASHDFPDNWPSLLPQICSHFKSSNPRHVTSALEILDHVLLRFRKVDIHNEQEFTNSMAQIVQFLLSAENNKPLLFIFDKLGSFFNNKTPEAHLANVIQPMTFLVNSLRSICHIDFPSLVEDDFAHWNNGLFTLLKFRSPNLHKICDDQGQPVTYILWTSIIHFYSLFTSQYGTFIQNYLSEACNLIWNLLSVCNSSAQLDDIVCHALEFLATVAGNSVFHTYFKDHVMLERLCKTVIAPNLTFRQEEEDLYRNNPDEYVVRDLEASNKHTRRRAASDLVQNLCMHYEKEIIGIFQEFIENSIAKFQENPITNWKNKDTALYLVGALSARSSALHSGVTTASSYFNIRTFFDSQVSPEISKTTAALLDSSKPYNIPPVLISDCIRFVTQFRALLQPAQIQEFFQNSVTLLDHPDPVVRIYSADAIFRFLSMRASESQLTAKISATSSTVQAKGFTITQDNLKPMLPKLLQSLVATIRRDHNPYTMRAFSRALRTAKSDVISHSTHIVNLFKHFLSLFTNVDNRAPINMDSKFSFFFFDSIAAFIRGACTINPTQCNPQQVTNIEKEILPLFSPILAQNMEDFLPFTLQIFGLMVVCRSKSAGPPPAVTNPEPWKRWPLNQNYLALTNNLFNVQAWRGKGNIYAFSHLLQKMIHHAPQQLAVLGYLKQLMAPEGVLVHLLAKDSYIEVGFQIIFTFLRYVPKDIRQPYISLIMRMLADRSTRFKTDLFSQYFALFVGYGAALIGPRRFFRSAEKIQAGFTKMLLFKVWVPAAVKIRETKVSRKKFMIIGVLRLLTEIPELVQPSSPLSIWINPWNIIFIKVLELLEFRQRTSTEEHLDESEIAEKIRMDDLKSGNQSSWRKLHSIGSTAADSDPFARSIPNLNVWVGKSLNTFETNIPPNVFASFIQSLSPDQREAVMKYMRN